MIIKSIWLRKIHKWVGLVIGLQFLVWAISGTAMALLDMDEVSGGEMAEQATLALPAAGTAWPAVRRAIGDEPVTGVSLRSLPDRKAFEIMTARGARLFDAGNGSPIHIDEAMAGSIARAAQPAGLVPANISRLTELDLAVRDHELPIWKVDFADEKHSSYYVSGTTGELLERRNDSWRWWDFFWMLHNMDYAKRSSFNHPLIIVAGFAMAWLAVTGFWLLFRTMWRHDVAALRRKLAERKRAIPTAQNL
jgi:uncharacterized iron-regulated membrane protein